MFLHRFTQFHFFFIFTHCVCPNVPCSFNLVSHFWYSVFIYLHRFHHPLQFHSLSPQLCVFPQFLVLPARPISSCVQRSCFWLTPISGVRLWGTAPSLSPPLLSDFLFNFYTTSPLSYLKAENPYCLQLWKCDSSTTFSRAATGGLHQTIKSGHRHQCKIYNQR